MIGWCVASKIPSSETQGQLVEAGKSLNGRGKKSGEEKSRTKIGAPGILLLTDQFRNHLKSLPVIGHKNIFVPNQSPALFVLLSWLLIRRCSPPNPLIACSPFIYLLVQESFPRSKSAIETGTMKPKKNSKFSMFVNQPEKASTEKIRLWTNRR